jgi:2-dehydro-3-deoxyphosphogluconate aldolase/(4S)-4-hydroxy-2-oxoglutarate aldolase
MMDLAPALGATGLVPVVVIDSVARATPLAAALRSAGLPTVEVTLRTEQALGALRVMAEDKELIVGAGTVVRPEQVHAAVAAGARYVVSPGFSAAVVKECEVQGVPCIPGVATATEIQCAVEHGIEIVKFFPAAAAGGAAAVSALSAPFSRVRFVPTGGITARTLPEYLAVPSVLAVGGSWMVAPDLVSAGDFGRITALSVEAVALARQTREARGR